MSTKKFNLTLSRAYAKTNGYWSIDLGPEEMKAIAQVKEGGRLVLQILKPESRKSERSPEAYFQYMSAEDVTAFKAKLKKPDSDQDF